MHASQSLPASPPPSFEAAAPGPYDLVLDAVGGDYEPRSLALLKRGPERGHFAGVLAHGWVKK
jgi:NADPH:quinone reductase-like Zn-dependent oxidoreductase